MRNFMAECSCPICKKNFIPAADHQWTVAINYRGNIPVCSYSCMRKWEIPRLEAEKKKAEKRKGTFRK